MLYIILKRWLYQYYWYFTYLSGKIIRNIEKSEYDVTVTSSLGVASQNWVWGFFVRRWSLCVNFMTLALLVPEIQRGGPRSPPTPVTDWPKKPSLNRVIALDAKCIGWPPCMRQAPIPLFQPLRSISAAVGFIKAFCLFYFQINELLFFSRALSGSNLVKKSSENRER